MADAPKRDKFASLAARQQQHQQQQVQQPPQRAASPKRDKFASLAAKQNQSAQSTASTPAVAPPKRDKFASLQQGGGSGGKFAKLQQKQEAPPSSSDGIAAAAAAAAVEAERVATQKRKEALLVRIRQQRQVLKDMEKAEGMVWNLIHLAKETAEGLADLKPPQEQQDDTAPDLSAISQNYRITLSQIHGLLKPHAHLVKAYENHQIDAEELDDDEEQDEEKKEEEDKADHNAPNMYAARVEMRLAQEKQQVLKALLELERQETAETAGPTDDSDLAAVTVGEKRKRDD